MQFIKKNKSDILFDLYGGSGTTIACCVKMNRNCIAIEKESENIKIIKKRLDNLQKGLDLDKKKYYFDYKLFTKYNEWGK